MTTVPLSWDPSYRLIRARLPRLDIFERLVAPEDVPGVLALAALTNPRLHPVIGALSFIKQSDFVTGPGADFIMAAFAYPGPSRFADGTSYGVYYAAKELETAVAEVSFRRERFARRTTTPPMNFDERIVVAAIDAAVVDVRGLPESDPIYEPDPDRCQAARAFGGGVRRAGADGIVYRSVRRNAGECVAVFTPRAIRNAQTAGFIGLRWDGKRIIDAYRMTPLILDYAG